MAIRKGLKSVDQCLEKHKLGKRDDFNWDMEDEVLPGVLTSVVS